MEAGQIQVALQPIDLQVFLRRLAFFPRLAFGLALALQGRSKQ